MHQGLSYVKFSPANVLISSAADQTSSIRRMQCSARHSFIPHKPFVPYSQFIFYQTDEVKRKALTSSSLNQLGNAPLSVNLCRLSRRPRGEPWEECGLSSPDGGSGAFTPKSNCVGLLHSTIGAAAGFEHDGGAETTDFELLHLDITAGVCGSCHHII